MKTKFPKTLHELCNHPEFFCFGASSDDWINDPDRMARCHEAAEDGSDGSFHAEVIQDWRDFLDTLEEAERSAIWHELDSPESEAAEAELERLVKAIGDEIDACESWHESQGTLWNQIG